MAINYVYRKTSLNVIYNDQDIMKELMVINPPLHKLITDVMNNNIKANAIIKSIIREKKKVNDVFMNIAQYTFKTDARDLTIVIYKNKNSIYRYDIEM